MTGGTITTSGLGANGAFATGTGSTVTLDKTTINATGDGGHAVMATGGGSMTLSNVEMTTAGKNSGAIATDRGGGIITTTGCTVTAKGVDSPAIYSTGAISVANSTLLATGAESAVIEGANSITLTDSSLSSTKAGKWGVLIYQSMSGDAEGAEGTFTMTGGTLALTAAQRAPVLRHQLDGCHHTHGREGDSDLRDPDQGRRRQLGHKRSKRRAPSC